MSTTIKRRMSVCFALLAIAAPFRAHAEPAQATYGQQAAIEVSGDVALSSLMALADGYLQKIADCFTAFAATREGRSDDPSKFGLPLAVIAERNVPALVWRAKPDGTYWSVQQGQMPGNIHERKYFQHVLDTGETVIGVLVVSTATGRSAGIVAVPVRAHDGSVKGVLGASVYLDELSARLNSEMALGKETLFYSFDYSMDYESLTSPLLALEWDSSLIFVNPLLLGPEIRATFEYMLARSEGAVRYRFRNQWRTVIFRRSQVTGWWYALGVRQGHGAAAK